MATIVVGPAAVNVLRALQATSRGMTLTALAGYVDTSRQNCEKICQRLRKLGFIVGALEDSRTSDGIRLVYKLHQRGAARLLEIDDAPASEDELQDAAVSADEVVRQAMATAVNSVFNLGRAP